MHKKLLLPLAAALLASTAAIGAELRVATANMSAYVDPGRDHSNVGSQNYVNAFDPQIAKDYTKPRAQLSP